MREFIHQGQLAGHKAAVAGAGVSGLAAGRLLSALGADVRLVESSSKVSRQVRQEAEKYSWDLRIGSQTKDDFEGTDLVVISPGIVPRKLKSLLPQKAQLVGEMELASWFTSEPIVAVTGSNGKTTTVSLISHVLRACGRSVFTGGNIGTPLSEYLLGGEKADILVLEVSSFQLQSMNSFHPRVGLLLNFSPNHLDHHADVEEYFEAKLKLFAKMNEKDLAVVNLNLRDEIEKQKGLKCRQLYFVPARDLECTVLRGEHNQANLEAACQACRFFGISREEFALKLSGFKPHPHRLERVALAEGVEYIDDSKSTTLDSLRAALESFSGSVILLAGGVFKGGDPAELNDLIREKVKQIMLFGAGRDVFYPAWSEAANVAWFPYLEEAVLAASRIAGSGDVILLSPATSSFDLFDNYKARGFAFQRAVQKAIDIQTGGGNG